MAFFGRKVQKNNGLTVLTVHTFFEGAVASCRCAPFFVCGTLRRWLSHAVAPARLLPFGKRGVLVRSPRRSPPHAPSCRLSWGGLVSPTPPPLQPPCKTPFRAAIRLILWGGLFWGKPIFAAAILPCSTPAAAVSGRALVWLHGASARSGIRRRRASGRASRIDNHPKGAICALERHENYAVHIAASRVRSTAKRHALDTVRVCGNNDAQGRERPQEGPFLVYPCPKLPLAFLWDELYNNTKAVRRWKEKRKTENLSINLGQRKDGK